VGGTKHLIAQDVLKVLQTNYPGRAIVTAIANGSSSQGQGLGDAFPIVTQVLQVSIVEVTKHPAVESAMLILLDLEMGEMT